MMVGTTRRQLYTIWSKRLYAKAIYDIEEPKYINDKTTSQNFSQVGKYKQFYQIDK